MNSSGFHVVASAIPNYETRTTENLALRVGCRSYLRPDLGLRFANMNIVNEVEAVNQSRNGVKVIVHRDKDGNTIVDASCLCFGSSFRVHDRMNCPNLLEQKNQRR